MAPLCGRYDYARLSLESGSLPGAFIAAWLGAWAGPLFYLSFPTLLLLFPDGRASGFRRWFMIVIVIVGVGLLTVAGAISFFALVTASSIFVTGDDPRVIAIATLAVPALFNPARKNASHGRKAFQQIDLPR